MSEVEHVLPVHDQLGEGPLWSVDEQALYWIDIVGNSFSHFLPTTGMYERVDVGVPIGVLALRVSRGLVMATKKGFAFWDNNTMRSIVNPEADKPHLRFNDGAVDSCIALPKILPNGQELLVALSAGTGVGPRITSSCRSSIVSRRWTRILRIPRCKVRICKG
jgi:hypothetical protein